MLAEPALWGWRDVPTWFLLETGRWKAFILWGGWLVLMVVGSNWGLWAMDEPYVGLYL